ncbi:MAG: hypothetical protein JXA99_08940 [Candidatus Lokiarchaeota archaeon]|nr:hypothetical protein [Candidatus Lokiarchaeota archaeon]
MFKFYFFNGNREGYINSACEKYVEIKSDPSEMIEDNPKMKAYEVTEEVIKAINSEHYKFIRVNLANGDMVGHTGNIKSAIIAAETVNECVNKIVDSVINNNGIAIVTADHGNLEDMSLEWQTSHTCNPVMFNIIDPQYKEEYNINYELNNPGLGNIAATILNLLGFEKPEGYKKSLIKFVI